MTRSLAAAASFGTTGCGVRLPGGGVAHQQPDEAADDDQRDRDDHVGGDIADPPHQPRSEEGRQGRAAHARAEDAGREARRAGSYHALTKGMPMAKVVPAMPRRKPKTRSSGYDLSDPAKATSSTGTVEARVSTVNITGRRSGR